MVCFMEVALCLLPCLWDGFDWCCCVLSTQWILFGGRHESLAFIVLGLD